MCHEILDENALTALFAQLFDLIGCEFGFFGRHQIEVDAAASAAAVSGSNGFDIEF